MSEILYSLLASVIAGFAVPFVYYFFKKRFEWQDSRKEKLLTITDENGKVRNIIMHGGVTPKNIQPLLMEEFLFENKVEKILNSYKNSHKNFNFQRNHSVDFLLRINDKVIALEVKTGKNKPTRQYVEFLKETHPDVNELMFLFNSDIPSEYLDAYKGRNEVKFISSPREKGLTQKLFNVLDTLSVAKA